MHTLQIIASTLLFSVPVLGLADGWDASLADCPRLPGELDDTARIQRLIDAHPSGAVYLPRGTYLVSSPLVISNMCSLAMNKGALVRATREMPFVLDVDNRAMIRPLHHSRLLDYNVFVRGGTLDGNGLAGCMRLAGFMHFTLADVSFLNGRDCGLRVDGGCELIANNLYFRCLKSGLAGNTAVLVNGGDSHYTDCVVVDYTVGFRLKTSGSNRLTRCHVWGGKLPPLRKGEPCEMLKDSVCFWLEGGGGAFLRDCYADTGKTGFLVDAKHDTQLVGCWYFNNYGVFKLDDVTIIDHRRGNLIVSDCRFSKWEPKSTVYVCTNAFATATWSDVAYSGFANPERLPGGVDYQAQDCASPDDWNLLGLGNPVRFASAPGAFAKSGSCRAQEAALHVDALRRRFPAVGRGRELVVKARATAPRTTRAQLALIQRDGKAWGLDLPLAESWREIRVPLRDLRYFKSWGLPPIADGETVDMRRLGRVRLTFGNWLCGEAADAEHGFEIESIRIVQ